MLIVGYVLIGVAVLATMVVLLYQAFGFGLGKDGEVIQNGLVFVSSTPNPADLTVGGLTKKYATNTRLTLPAGTYTLQLTREGYRPWQREVLVEGGRVLRLDYPFLFPTSLTTTTVDTYDGLPALATQSPDRRWLLVEHPGTITSFSVYDLKNPQQPSKSMELPPELLTPTTGSQGWQLVEWSNDNVHVLLKHMLGTSAEFILVNRENPAESVNLTQALAANVTDMSLINKKYDQYYLYTKESGSLQKASLKDAVVTPYLDHVLAYKSYDVDTMLYATASDTGSGKVRINLLQGDKTYTIRELNAGGTYLLDIAKHEDMLFVVAASSADDRAYIYRDPVAQLQSEYGVAVPVRVLRIAHPSYVSFSNNTQFIVVENGVQFGTYDVKYERGYTYNQPDALDAPQQHAKWMDGNRIAYVSNGNLVVFDYDGSNKQRLMPAYPSYEPFFGQDYKYVYALSAGSSQDKKQTVLTSTALRTRADL